IDDVFTPGQAYIAEISGTRRVVIDADGNVYKYSWGLLGHTAERIGSVTPQGDGSFEFSNIGGNGGERASNVLDSHDHAKQAFELLKDVSTVEAVGIGKSLHAEDLAAYDSDG